MQGYEERTIDGRVWKVQAFPATEGLRLLTALTKLFGKSLGRAMGGIKGSVLDMDISVLGEAVGDLAERLGETEIVALVKRLLALTMLDNAGIVPQFDMVFSQSYGTLFKVLGFVLEVNFKVPLPELMARAGGTGPLGATVAGTSAQQT